jgi:glycosyltransferase involved in cell wall biosynthesis
LKFQATDIGFNRLAEAAEQIDPRRIGKNGWYRSLLGTNSTFTRAALEACQGFDEQYDYFLDESDVCWRVQAGKGLIAYSDQLYLRHEFAQSANRLSKHNFNWFAICKNTAYFVAAFSGMRGKDLVDYLKERLQRERVMPLDEALKVGEITKAERDAHVDRIWKGMEQGLADAKHFPRRRILRNAGVPFLGYLTSPTQLKVGVDVPRLHVCIVTKEFPPFAGTGGIGTLYYHLASELLLMGHEVTVIAPGDVHSEAQHGRLRVIWAVKQSAALDGLDAGFHTNIEWTLSALVALRDLHARHPVHVVDSALWDTETLAIAMVPKHARPPVVLRLVTPFPVAARTNAWQVPERISDFYKLAERKLLSYADAVIPISGSIAKTIQSEYDVSRDRRWREVPCGVAYWPSFDFRHGYASAEGLAKLPAKTLQNRKLIVFIGRLEQRKGVDLLLAAAGKFLGADPEAELVLAGRDVEGWAGRLNGCVAPEHLDRVHLLGEVDDVTREKLLSRAYCVAFPSRYESFGLVPLEAFVHATPVVASASGAIPEVVTEECGLLFEPGDADSLADAVSRLLSDPDLRARLSEGARKRVRTLSSRKMAQRSVELYASLC